MTPLCATWPLQTPKSCSHSQHIDRVRYQFQRRCYWMLDGDDSIVLVHYLAANAAARLRQPGAAPLTAANLAMQPRGLEAPSSSDATSQSSFRSESGARSTASSYSDLSEFGRAGGGLQSPDPASMYIPNMLSATGQSSFRSVCGALSTASCHSDISEFGRAGQSAVKLSCSLFRPWPLPSPFSGAHAHRQQLVEPLRVWTRNSGTDQTCLRLCICAAGTGR